MKSIIILVALLSVAFATPVAQGPEPTLAPIKCTCTAPKCPLEIIAECKCKNAHAQACYEAWLAKDVKCPTPTPKLCGPITTVEEPTKPLPTPTVVPPIRKFCGGIAGLPCPEGLICVDYIGDTCDPKHGGADCIGICVSKGGSEEIRCAGKQGAQCPKGWVCVDDPEDSCDPVKGGKDCGGFCILES